MSGIFGIFNDSRSNNSISLNKEKENSQIHLLSKVKSVNNDSHVPFKIFSSSKNKSKGLSIRSKSDLNISTSSSGSLEKNNLVNCLKVQDKSCFAKKQSSPLKILMKSPKKKVQQSLNIKKLSPKISAPIMQNMIDDFKFSKPYTPKMTKKSTNIKHPEPECLAGDFDPRKFIDMTMENSLEDDLNWMRSTRKSNQSIGSIDDEGFISDLDNNSFEVMMDQSSSMMVIDDIELPDISDIED
ncbi:uncharacterized protein LOC106649234 [Trichogramma pretiosum]|uniref:uncharacterized protein LOC106649234 n=1 Tax=Trichogramma pretiosum TaxID=7493 RepID=UPI0006C9DC10|nr:uncharacterized protein LOC106649234 [Trichogramma pretiosum]